MTTLRKTFAAVLREAFKAIICEEQEKPTAKSSAKGLSDTDCDRYLKIKKRDGNPIMEEI